MGAITTFCIVSLLGSNELKCIKLAEHYLVDSNISVFLSFFNLFFTWKLIVLQCCVGLRLGSPCYVAGSHYLSLLHMVVCIYRCYFLCSSHSFLPPLCVFISLHCYSFSQKAFISVSFLTPFCIRFNSMLNCWCSNNMFLKC